jgi:predicted outer membrane repeat protein
MHLKPARTAASAAAIGGVLVLGLGSAQAAMAKPDSIYHVPCSMEALKYDLAHVSTDGTLFLASGCTYYLNGGMADNVDTLTIVGDDTTIRGGGPDSDFIILVVPAGKTLTLDGVNFTEGSSTNGGAIDNSGDLTVNGGTFSHNNAEFGAAIDDATGALTINDAVFTSNESEEGGAVFVEDATGATITGAHFSQNKAEYGGAIYVEEDLTVADSTFTGNTADQGGAIYNDATLTLTNVTDVAGSGNAFTGNIADQGGGIYNDDIVIAGDSMIVYNAAHDLGGGVYNACGVDFSAPGSTIYGNVTDNIYNVGACG